MTVVVAVLAVAATTEGALASEHLATAPLALPPHHCLRCLSTGDEPRHTPVSTYKDLAVPHAHTPTCDRT